MEPSARKAYQAGDLTVHTGRQQVVRAGEPIRLRGLSYRMLLALIEAAPNVVSQDDLIDRVWDGRIVSPETITQRVKLLRQALGDEAQNPRYIGLVRGGGYQMLADVAEIDPEPGNVTRGLVGELGRRRVLQVAFLYVAVAWTITEALTFIIESLPVFPAWMSSVIAVAFVAGFPLAMFMAWRFDISPEGVRRAEPSSRSGRVTIVAAVALMVGATAGLSYLLIDAVAVDEQAQVGRERGAPSPADVVALLPLTLTSSDPEFRQLGASLNDELRDRLRNLGLKMVARTSSHAFRDQAVLMTEISRQLGAGTLIEGSIGGEGGEVRISIAIVDGASGVETWSDYFVSDAENLLAFNQRIADAIVAHLAPSKIAQAAAPPSNETSYNLFLLARHFEQQVRDQRVVDSVMLDRSIELYRRVVADNPESAIAHSRLGGALLYRGKVREAQAPIFRALDLNPDLADAQYALGLYHWSTGNSAGGEAYARAVELDPNHSDALAAYGHWLWIQSDYVTPLGLFQRALELDPMALPRYADLGSLYGWRGEGQQVREVAEQVEQRFKGYAAHELIARLYELSGDLDLAIAWAWEGRRSAPRDLPDPTWQLAELYARIGDFATASRLMTSPDIAQYYWQRRYDDLIDLAEELIILNPEESRLYYQLAFAYNVKGNHAAAARILQLAGLPESVYADSRRSPSLEAMATLADALIHGGDRETGVAVAAWMRDHLALGVRQGGGGSWWSRVYSACSEMALGNREAALDHLDRVTSTEGLAWNPLLRDAPCFALLAEEPRYLRVLDMLEQRRADLRARLPQTLEQRGVDVFAMDYMQSLTQDR